MTFRAEAVAGDSDSWQSESLVPGARDAEGTRWDIVCFAWPRPVGRAVTVVAATAGRGRGGGSPGSESDRTSSCVEGGPGHRDGHSAAASARPGWRKRLAAVTAAQFHSGWPLSAGGSDSD